MNTVITIGREFGSGGKYIGEKLSKELNMKLYDKELLQKVSEETDIDINLLNEVDEKQERSFWYTFATGMYSVEEGINSISEIPSNERVFIEQAKVIEELAEIENCIIIGRCANVILQDKPNVLKVFIYASDFDFKVRRKMEYGNLTEEEAKEQLERIDKERATYYQYFSNQKWGEREGYDLLIDTSKIGVDAAVNIIKKYLELKNEI